MKEQESINAIDMLGNKHDLLKEGWAIPIEIMGRKGYFFDPLITFSGEIVSDNLKAKNKHDTPAI
jgi:hypothetical protein